MSALPDPQNPQEGDENPCPHCGYDDPDIWEYHREGDHDVDCPNCGKPIRVTVIRETRYEVGLQPERRTA